MRRYIMNGPQVEPLTLAEAKRFLRVDHVDDDGLIQALIKGARERVEARTGRALIDQTWRIILDAWPWGGRFALPVLPVSAVLSVTVKDMWGVGQVVSPPVYNLLAGTEPPVLDVSGAPEPGLPHDGITIEVTAGYGPTAAAVPEPLRQAMRLMVAHAYAGAGPDARADAGPEPRDIGMLLRPYRLGRIGAPLMRVSA